MRHTLFICLISFLIVPGSYGQKKSSLLPTGTSFLRFNLTSIIDPVETNFSIGYEYKLKQDISISADVGYIFFSQYYQQSKKTNGFIFRPAVRWYFERTGKFYGEFELHYKRVDYTIEDWIGRNAVNGVASYEEFTTFKSRKESAGANIKAGFQEKITRNGRLYMEIYVGLGAKTKKQKLVNQPKSSTYPLSDFFDFNNNSDLFPSAPGGVRLLFRL